MKPLEALKNHCDNLRSSHKVVAEIAGIPTAYTAGFTDALDSITDYLALLQAHAPEPGEASREHLLQTLGDDR